MKRAVDGARAAHFACAAIAPSAAAKTQFIAGAMSRCRPTTAGSRPSASSLEFRVGPYTPAMGGNDAFKTFFSDDSGPLLALELDVIAYRLQGHPVSRAAAAASAPPAINGQDARLGRRCATSEETTLDLLPLNLLGRGAHRRAARASSRCRSSSPASSATSGRTGRPTAAAPTTTRLERRSAVGGADRARPRHLRSPRGAHDGRRVGHQSLVRVLRAFRLRAEQPVARDRRPHLVRAASASCSRIGA